VVLATAVAVCFSAFAGAASAKKYSAKQKAQIRKSLKKQIKKNPAVIKRKSFIRKAALVNFVLPVTIRLRNQCAAGVGGQAACVGGPTDGTALNQTRNPQANVNLGPSLGSRTVALSGSLAAEVQFSDSYDGGALGNVGVKILPSTTKVLQSSSVPLLWNPDVQTTANTRSDRNFAAAAVRAGSSVAPVLQGGVPGWGSVLPGTTQGCGDFTNATNASRNIAGTAPVAGQGAPLSPNAQGAYNALWYGASLGAYPYPGTQGGLPGYPVIDPSVSLTTPAYFLPVFPGIDDPTGIVGGSYSTGNNDNVGPNPNPFPYLATTQPGGATYNAADTVLRTNALSLSIAPSGIQVDGATGTSTPAGPTGLTNGPQGTQSFITGQSGGQANLFGNIPGKNDSIDVTVNLRTAINSIFRIVDQDVFDTPLVSGQSWPAGIFNCRQIWSGAVQNYIPGVRLRGSLRIAPAITKDGKIRIAKATVSTSQDTHLALSACLMPYRSYGADAGPGYPTTTNNRPPSGLPSAGGATPALGTQAQVIAGGGFANAQGTMTYNNASLPFVNSESAAPQNVACNATPTQLVRNSGLTGSVESQTGINNIADGYSTALDGSQATVAGDISVQDLDVDVIIGDN